MNILITTSCSKGCSFCFAKDKNHQAEYMSLANFQKLLDMVQRSTQRPNIKILGGEPTQHPQFGDFIQELETRNIAFSLITNCLWPEGIQEILDPVIAQGLMQSALVNAAELQGRAVFENFQNNYDYLEKKSREIHSLRVSCGVTFHRDFSVAEEVAYVQWLLDNVVLHQLRISIDFLGENTDDTMLIKNTVYGDKIQAILKLCGTHLIPVSGDCVVYPCMFEDAHFARRILPELAKTIQFTCADYSMPFDIYPDLSYFHCYPAHCFGGKNILDFQTPEQAMEDMRIRKVALMNMRSIPKDCQDCTWHKHSECAGPCLGCSKLNEKSALLKVLD